MQAAVFAVVLVAAVLGAAVGMAGGVFIVPALTVVFRVPWEAAVAVSLVSVVASSSAAAPAALRRGLVNLRLAVVLEVATVAGALLGVVLAGVLPVGVLYGVFVTVLAASAAQVLRPRRPRAAAAGTWGSRLGLDAAYRTRAGASVPYRVGSVPAGLSLMFGAGALSSMLGIGSGVLKVPALDAALRLPLKVSSATANLMIGVTACGTAAAALLHGSGAALDLVAPVAVASVAGSALGARVLLRVPVAVLRVTVAVMLVAVAVLMVAAALGGMR